MAERSSTSGAWGFAMLGCIGGASAPIEGVLPSIASRAGLPPPRASVALLHVSLPTRNLPSQRPE